MHTCCRVKPVLISPKPSVLSKLGTGDVGSITTSPAAGRPRACAATATWCANREPKEAPIST
eukprot:scaffold144292_cov121-Phaeocystis_antarctica.AAC.1